MALKAGREDTWVAGIEDRPGALAKKLETLARAGAELEFLIARRAPEKPGTGVVFLTPLRGAAQVGAAKKAGFHESKSMHSVRVEGVDRPGVGAEITRALAAKGINLRGLSAAVIGKRFVAYLALDTVGDANSAIRILRQMS
jgi:predicted amino acid-binding ACT domain protein